jgi:predicted nicotinamide N-methyase
VGKDASCTRVEGFPAVWSWLDVGARTVGLYTVPDLERLVDRGALLRGEVEPPYWAHLWAGARGLAVYVARRLDVAGRRVLDLGCGLGLPGLVAAHAGAYVTFVDAARPALAFVRASAWASGLPIDLLCTDFRTLGPRARFDVILAAEVAYDRSGFADLVDVFRRHLSPGGLVLLADGFRTDTRGLYRELARRGLGTWAVDCRVVDEGRPGNLRLVHVTAGGACRRRDQPVTGPPLPRD